MKMSQISLTLLLVSGLFATTVKPANDGIVFQWNLSEDEKSLYVAYRLGEIIFGKICILAKTVIENPKITTGVLGCTALGVITNHYLRRKRLQHRDPIDMAFATHKLQEIRSKKRLRGCHEIV